MNDFFNQKYIVVKYYADSMFPQVMMAIIFFLFYFSDLKTVV